MYSTPERVYTTTTMTIIHTKTAPLHSVDKSLIIIHTNSAINVYTLSGEPATLTIIGVSIIPVQHLHYYKYTNYTHKNSTQITYSNIHYQYCNQPLRSLQRACEH